MKDNNQTIHGSRRQEAQPLYERASGTLSGTVHGIKEDYQGNPQRPSRGRGGDVAGNSRLGSLKRLVKEMGIPVTLLPDVRDFKVTVSRFDWLFELFGIVKREEPVISYEPYRNKRINRYIVHQMLRLGKCRRNPVLYWTIAKQLMKSTSFVVSAIHHVLPG
jgi:hypothetical protein